MIMRKKLDIDDAEISPAPEGLTESAAPISQEIGIGHKIVRPKRPQKKAAYTGFKGYEILKEATREDGGRHFIFKFYRDGEPVNHIMNVDPYYGYALNDANDFWQRLKHEKKLSMKSVGRSEPNYHLAKKILGIHDSPQEPISGDTGNIPEQLEFDLDVKPKLEHPDSDDWRGANWLARSIREAQYGFGNHPYSHYPEYERYAEEQREETSNEFAGQEPEPEDLKKLSFLLEKIFKDSIKYSKLKSDLMLQHYEENPLKERTVRRLEKNLDQMGDAAIRIVLPGFRKWIYRHDDFEGWWSEFAYRLLTEGKSDQGYAGTFDISEDILEGARETARRQLASDYIDAEMYASAYFDDFTSAHPDIVMKYLAENHADEVQEWMQDNDVAGEDFSNYVLEFVRDESDMMEDAAGDIDEFEEWLLSDESPMANFQTFHDAIEWFGDGNPYWIDLVKEAAMKNGMEYWRNLYPGIESVEDDVREAIEMMENASTAMEKMVALNYALNVQHYHGNMMEDHVGATDIGNLTGLSTEELDRLSNLEASSYFGLFKTAKSEWTQSQVYCENGICYDIDRLIEVTGNNNVVRVKVEKVAPQLMENAWGDDEICMSPLGVLRNPTLNRDHKIHMRRIQTADMSHPILIRFSDGKVIDGYHRLSRAFLVDDKYIDAIYIQDEQMDDAIISSS